MIDSLLMHARWN